MSTQTKIREITSSKLAEATRRYKKVFIVEIDFVEDLGLRIAMAIEYNDGTYAIKYLKKAITEIPLSDFEKIIAHEVAHIVVFSLYNKHGGHNKEWKKICLDLGGDGKRYMNVTTILKPQRNHTYFKYILNSKKEIWFASNKHKKIQQGILYTLVEGKEEIRQWHYTGNNALRSEIDESQIGNYS